VALCVFEDNMRIKHIKADMCIMILEEVGKE
jgi:hypothetical protein